jgi:hypothetical protein
MGCFPCFVPVPPEPAPISEARARKCAAFNLQCFQAIRKQLRSDNPAKFVSIVAVETTVTLLTY